ncbi:MAG TPA: hypothetical protein VNA24_01725 [Hyalangium sp.]|nr:hypothetical protein [Hyalangium sp.]
MATLRRGLVDTVKKAAEKVRTRGVQVAAKAGTRGARALVETTAAAVKTVDKFQAKLGRGARKSSTTSTPEALPVELREAGRKTMPTAAPKRSKQAKSAGKQFKVKRGQKHPHSGR